MISDFLNNLKNEKMKAITQKEYQIIRRYNFLFISDNFYLNQNKDIYQEMKESKIIIINYSEQENIFIFVM